MFFWLQISPEKKKIIYDITKQLPQKKAYGIATVSHIALTIYAAAVSWQYKDILANIRKSQREGNTSDSTSNRIIYLKLQEKNIYYIFSG
jgi:hypothetical protein